MHLVGRWYKRLREGERTVTNNLELLERNYEGTRSETEMCASPLRSSVRPSDYDWLG